MLCAALALGTPSQAWASRITDASEGEGTYLYPRPFGDTGITLMLPFPYTVNGMIADGDDFKQLVALTDAMDAEPHFVISAIPFELPADTAFEELNPLFFMPLMLRATDTIGEMWMQYTDDFGEDVPAMRITWVDEASGRHIAGFRDGWLMVLSLLPGTEKSRLDGLEDYENVIFNYMMVPYNFLPTVEMIELPDSSLKLVLPEGMQAIVDRYDEYTDRELVVYHITPPDTPNQAIIVLTTVRKEGYQGKLLHEFSGQELIDEVSSFPLGLGEVTSDWLHADSELPLLMLHEVGYGSEGRKNPDAYHLIAIKDGWLLCFLLIDHGVWPVEDMLSMQMDFMLHMLDGRDEAPSL